MNLDLNLNINAQGDAVAKLKDAANATVRLSDVEAEYQRQLAARKVPTDPYPSLPPGRLQPPRPAALPTVATPSPTVEPVRSVVPPTRTPSLLPNPLPEAFPRDPLPASLKPPGLLEKPKDLRPNPDLDEAFGFRPEALVLRPQPSRDLRPNRDLDEAFGLSPEPVKARTAADPVKPVSLPNPPVPVAQPQPTKVDRLQPPKPLKPPVDLRPNPDLDNAFGLAPLPRPQVPGVPPPLPPAGSPPPPKSPTDNPSPLPAPQQRQSSRTTSDVLLQVNQQSIASLKEAAAATQLLTAAEREYQAQLSKRKQADKPPEGALPKPDTSRGEAPQGTPVTAPRKVEGPSVTGPKIGDKGYVPSQGDRDAALARERAAATQRELANEAKIAFRKEVGEAKPAGGNPTGIEATLGKLGIAAGLAAAGFAAVTKGMSNTADVINITGNKMLTNAQKNEALASQFIPGADSFFKFRDAINGTTNALGENQRRHELALTEISARSEAAPQIRNLEMERNRAWYASGFQNPIANADSLPQLFPGNAEQKKAAVEGLKFKEMPSIDRSTAQGKIDYDEERQLNPLRNEEVRANRRAAEARIAAEEAKKQLLLPEQPKPLEIPKGEVPTRITEQQQALQKFLGSPPPEQSVRPSVSVVDPLKPAAIPDFTKPYQPTGGTGFEQNMQKPVEGQAKDKSKEIAEAAKTFEANPATRVEVARIRDDRAASEVEKLRLAENTGGPRNAKGMDSALKAQAEATTERIAAEKDYQAALEKSRDLGIAAAEAESNARKAGINVMKAELDILRQREQRMSSAAQRFGEMTKIERQMALQSLDAVQRYGIENVPEDVRQRAKNAAPLTFASQAEREGENSQEFRGLQERAPADAGRGTLKENRQQQDKLQANVEVSVKLDEGTLAIAISRELGAVLNRLVESINSVVSSKVRSVETGQMQKAQGELK